MSAAVSSNAKQPTAATTSRHRTFTRAEVAEHCEMDDAWVTCGGYVHDVTPFMDQHPGGAKLLKPYLGRDVEEGMEKLGHSSYSYGLLKEYIIGVIEGAELRMHYQPNPKSLRGYDPEVLDKAVDFTKPTVWQVIKMGDKYWPWIESRPFVNNPMAKGGLILFQNRVMEVLSRYPWWYIWVMWPPLCLWQLYHGFFQSAAATHLTQVAAAAAGALNAGDVVAAATATTSSFLYSNATAQAMSAGVAAAPWFPRAVLESAADSLTFATMPQALIRATFWNLTTTFLLGMFAWTIFEYVFHRFVFHLESHGNFGNGFHYFMHGIHHLTPTDSTRLTFPALFVGAIAYGVHVLMRESIPLVAKASTCPFQAVFAGFLFAYTLYDTAHYFFHHSDFDNALFRRLKTAHLNHHYKNEEMNFGVTSPLWDHVFGTWDPQTGKDRAGSGKARAAPKKKVD